MSKLALERRFYEIKNIKVSHLNWMASVSGSTAESLTVSAIERLDVLMTDSYVSAKYTRRQPKQNRSRALVEAIYQSCIKIIESGHGEVLTVSLIAKTAGITLSSFYQYFPNVQSAVAATLLKYDQDVERYRAIENKLQEKTLTIEQAICFLVDAVCDRHLRFLHKYDRLYRRHHRLVNAQLCVGFRENGLAKMINWEVWLKGFLQNYCTDSYSVSDLTVFMATATLIELTSKALEINPELLSSDIFRKKICELMLSLLSV